MDFILQLSGQFRVFARKKVFGDHRSTTDDADDVAEFIVEKQLSTCNRSIRFPLQIGFALPSTNMSYAGPKTLSQRKFAANWTPFAVFTNWPTTLPALSTTLPTTVPTAPVAPFQRFEAVWPMPLVTAVSVLVTPPTMVLMVPKRPCAEPTRRRTRKSERILVRMKNPKEEMIVKRLF